MARCHCGRGVASKSQLDLHDFHCMNVIAFLKTSVGWNPLYVYSQYHRMRAHPVTCFSTYPRQRSQPKRACAGNFAVVLEDLSRKQIPKSSRKKLSRKQPPKADAKKTTSATRGRYAEGLRGRRSFCNRI